MPRKVFVAGEILTAADVNTNLMDQAVMSFSGTAARGSAIPTPTEGMAAYLNDSNILSLYDGSTWKNSLGVTGGILQVVSTTKTDTFTSSGAGFVSVTGLSVSITPSSTTSKILVLASITGGAEATDAYRLERNGTALSVADTAGERTRATGSWGDGAGAASSTSGLVFLDSPATTSSRTYQIQIDRGASGTAYINRSPTDEDSPNRPRGTSTIIVMEVAA